MANRIYSPQLSAPVVRALYFEAQRKGMPMTRLADSLLRDALQATETWQRVGEPQANYTHKLAHPQASDRQ